MGDEVRTEENFFRWTITINSFTGRSLSARLQGSLRLLPFPLPASPSVHLAMDFPLARSATGLPCSAEMTRSVRTDAGSGDTHGRIIGSLAMLIREIRRQLSVDP